MKVIEEPFRPAPHGAGEGNRTPNPSRATDFKSVAYTSSATPAYLVVPTGFEPVTKRL